MPIPLTIEGQTALYPLTGEIGWGDQATLWAQLVTNAIGSGGNPTFNSIVVLTSSDFQGPVDFGDDVTFTGTSPTLYGDMTNTPYSSRFKLQSSVLNGVSRPFVVPNGTANNAGWDFFNSSDPNNATQFGVYVAGTTGVINASKSGSGSFGTIQVYTSDVLHSTFTADGKLGIGTPTPGQKLTVQGNGLFINTAPAAYEAVQIWNTEAVGSGGGAKVHLIDGPNAERQAGVTYNPGNHFAIGTEVDNANTPIIFWAGNAIERARIGPSGGLAIAAPTAPADSLIVRTIDSGYTISMIGKPSDSTSVIRGINASGANEMGSLVFGGGGNVTLQSVFGNGGIYCNTGGFNRLFISGQGTVIVNAPTIADDGLRVTAAPFANVSTITMVGSSVDNRTKIRGVNNAYSAETGWLQFDGNGTTTLASTGAGALYLLTNGTNRLGVTASGGILVNTTGIIGDAVGQMQINSNGQFGYVIKNAAAGGFWYVGPNASNHYCIFNESLTGQYMATGSTGWSPNVSDIRAKTDIVDIDGSKLWNFFKGIRTVNGRYKTDEEGKKRAFLIANDWGEVDDVQVEKEDGMLTIVPTNTLPYAYAIIKELMKKVEALEEEIIRNK